MKTSDEEVEHSGHLTEKWKTQRAAGSASALSVTLHGVVVLPSHLRNMYMLILLLECYTSFLEISLILSYDFIGL